MTLNKNARAIVAVLALAAMADMAVARADEAQAKNLLKKMSDYLAAQKAISLDYNSTFEVVTKQDQRLRPGQLRDRHAQSPRQGSRNPHGRLFECRAGV